MQYALVFFRILFVAVLLLCGICTIYDLKADGGGAKSEYLNPTQKITFLTERLFDQFR